MPHPRTRDRALSAPLSATPPAYLSAKQAEIWEELFLSRPSGYFSASDAPLLAALCVATAEHRRISAGLDGEYDTDTLAALTRMLASHAEAIARLSTKLRLSPQSRYTAKQAAAASRGLLGRAVQTGRPADNPDRTAAATLAHYRRQGGRV